MALVTNLGAQVNGEYLEHVYHKSDKRDGTKRLIVFCHGAGVGGNFVSTQTFRNQGLPQALEYVLNTGRYQLVNTGMGGDTWGSNAGGAALEAARAWAQSTGGAKAGKFAVVCWSMGNQTAFSYARQYGIASLAGIVAAIPVCDLNASFNRGTDAVHGGAYATINTVFGVTNDAQWNAIRASVNPPEYASTWAGLLKWRVYYRNDDTIEPPHPQVDGLAAALGSSAQVTDTGTGNHTWCIDGPTLLAELDALDWDAVDPDVQFFAERSGGLLSPGFANTYWQYNGVFAGNQDGAEVTGDLDLRVKVALDSYRPLQNNELFARWNGGTTTHFALVVRSDGKLSLSWKRADGVNQFPVSTAALPSTWQPWKIVWLRVTRTVSSGAVKFFYSTDDGLTWTQLGSDVISSAGASMKTGTDAPLRIDSTSITQSFIMYRFRLGNGATWTIDADFTKRTGVSNLSDGQVQTTDNQGGSWTSFANGLYRGCTMPLLDTAAKQLAYKKQWAGAEFYDGNPASHWGTRSKQELMGFNVTGLMLWNGITSTRNDLDDILFSGIRMIRLDFNMDGINNGSEGVYNFSTHDAVVTECVNRGIKIVGNITYSGSWNREAGGTQNYSRAPADTTKWATAARAIVNRYKDRVHVWEVWNEPNNEPFLTTSGSLPAKYVDILKKTYPQLKAEDPNCLVLTGGMANVGHDGVTNYDIPQWVDALYANGVAGYFDALNLHPYNWSNDPHVAGVNLQLWNGMTKPIAIYSLMCQNGDGNKRIWATESGTATGTWVDAVTEAEQARRIDVDSDRWFRYPFGGPWLIHMHRETGTDTTNREAMMGVRKFNRTAKAAIATIQTLVTQTRKRWAE